eukprot:gene29446-5792_t
MASSVTTSATPATLLAAGPGDESQEGPSSTSNIGCDSLVIPPSFRIVSSTQYIGSSSKTFKGAWIDSVTMTSNTDVGGDLAVNGIITVASNIMPNTVSAQNIGSAAKPFKEAWIDTLHTTNTQNMGATHVLSNLDVSGVLTVASNIMPTTVSTQNIGSAAKPFKEAWIDTLHTTNTLNMVATPVFSNLDVNGVLTVASNIMPTTVSTQNIGSAAKPFKEAWIDTLHTTNTLNMVATPVFSNLDVNGVLTVASNIMPTTVSTQKIGAA